MSYEEFVNIKQDLLIDLNIIEIDAKEALYSEKFSWGTKQLFTLWLFIMIDKYSGYWAGWSHGKSKNNKMSQTQRMIDFLKQYLGYGEKESEMAIKIFRHNLAHSFKSLGYKKENNDYGWVWGYECDESLHWTFEKINGQKNSYRFYFGFFNLLNDLKLGVEKYCDELVCSEQLQKNYNKYLKEILK